MSDVFRDKAKEDFARLLDHYRRIELWIKRAEQINKKAIISAMNELRYAARQLFNAIRIFDKDALTEGDKSVITKRIVIAEQYFLNAEHDIWDAIVGYYNEVVEHLDIEYGVSSIAVVFTGYPLFRDRVAQCLDLISEAREYYDRRPRIYETLRVTYFPYFLAEHKRLLEAEVSAKETKSHLETELVRAKARTSKLEKINLALGIAGLIIGIVGLLSIPLSFYLWAWAKDDYCAAYNKRPLMGIVCNWGPQKPEPEKAKKPE